MFCSKCGKELDDDVRFCNSCGTPTPTADAQGPLPPGPPPPTTPASSAFIEAPKHRISVPVLIAVIVAAVLVISAAAVVPAVLVFSNSRKAAQRKTCQANQRNVQMAIMTYAADSPDETYPTSLQDLTSGESPVLDSIPTCPSGHKPYIWVKGGINTPPSISCPNRADHAL